MAISKAHNFAHNFSASLDLPLEFQVKYGEMLDYNFDQTSN